MIHLTSFLLGAAAALTFPSVSRVLRPVLVEAAVAGMALFDETRRVIAEQLETMEDIAAEARARREDALAASNGHHDANVDAVDTTAGAGDEAPRARRRAEGTSRRRSA